MLKSSIPLAILLFTSLHTLAQAPAPLTHQLSPSRLDTESGDHPFIAFNTANSSGSKFARLYSYNTTGVTRDATVYIQEFDQQLKLMYSKVVPIQDSVLVGNSKATRVFYLGGILYFCYHQVSGPNQSFYFFKSAFENGNLSLTFVHVEKVESSFFDADDYFQKTFTGYDFSYDFATSPDGQLLLFSLLGSRRTGEKNTLLLRTLKSNFEFIWEKRIDLPTTPNVFMLNNAGKQASEIFSQDYSFRPYAVNQVMNGIPQLTDMALDNTANAFVRIDETTETRKLFGIKTRYPAFDRDWYGVYDLGSRVIKQFDAGSSTSFIANVSHDSVIVASFEPRIDEIPLPHMKASVTGISPKTPAKEAFVDKVKAVRKDAAGNTFIVTIHTQEKKADGFSMVKLNPQGAVSKIQFIPVKNFSEFLWADMVGETFTVFYSVMPNSQVVTGFNGMLSAFTSYLMQAEMDANGTITTNEIYKVSAEGPNLVYVNNSGDSRQLLFGWYDHERKKLYSYSLLNLFTQRAQR